MITETGKRAKDATISDLGIKNAIVHWNLSPKELVDIADSLDSSCSEHFSSGDVKPVLQQPAKHNALVDS